MGVTTSFLLLISIPFFMFAIIRLKENSEFKRINSELNRIESVVDDVLSLYENNKRVLIGVTRHSFEKIDVKFYDGRVFSLCFIEQGGELEKLERFILDNYSDCL